MNRITKHQFHAMLLIPDAFLLLCIQGSLSLMTVIGIAAGAVVQAAVVIPFMLMFRDREEPPKGRCLSWGHTSYSAADFS